jgi:hypothetical protein
MSFRKFGTSDDQRVLADPEDTQGVRKEATERFSDKDREDLRRENQDTDR